MSCKNNVARSRSISTLAVCASASRVQSIISSCMVGSENYLAQMTIKTRHYVLCMNHVATSKVKFTVRTYSLYIGLDGTYSCAAHNFVVGPASGMMRYKDPVFPSVCMVPSPSRRYLTQGIRQGHSVVWTHFFSSLIISPDPYFSTVVFRSLYPQPFETFK